MVLLFRCCLLTILAGACVSPFKTISLQKTACYGTCPVYTMDIYSNGEVILTAEKFVDLGEGRFRSKLSDRQLEELQQAFDQARFFEYDDAYAAQVSDLPTIYISFDNGSSPKTIQLYGTGPEPLMELADKVHSLIKTQDWEKLKAR